MLYSRDAQVASVQFHFSVVEHIPMGRRDKKHYHCKLLKQLTSLKLICEKQVSLEVL